MKSVKDDLDLKPSKTTFILPPPIDFFNFMLAQYTVYLADGNSLKCQSIKAATMREYLRAVASMLQAYHPTLDDPR